MRWIAVVLLLLALAVGGWMLRGEMNERIDRWLGGGSAESAEVSAAATPEAGRRAEEKVIALGRGERDEIALSETELNGWIRHGLVEFFPDFVSDVAAQMDEQDRLTLAGRLAVADVPGLDELGVPRFLLGDTVPVRVVGRVDGLRPGRGLLHVASIGLGSLTLPDAMRDELVKRFGAGGEAGSDGVPAGAVSFELPEFVADIAVRDRQLILRRSADG